MAFKVITIPLPETQDREAEVNRFLASHAVVGVQRRFIERGDEAYLVFLIEYAQGGGAAGGGGGGAYAAGQSANASRRRDWRAELDDDQYRVFNLLRQEREAMAQEEGTKVFNIFTNAQLAEMVRRKVHDKAGLAQVPQVGEGRLQKYGQRILGVLAREYAAGNRPEAGGAGGAAAP